MRRQKIDFIKNSVKNSAPLISRHALRPSYLRFNKGSPTALSKCSGQHRTGFKSRLNRSEETTGKVGATS